MQVAFHCLVVSETWTRSLAMRLQSLGLVHGSMPGGAIVAAAAPAVSAVDVCNGARSGLRQRSAGGGMWAYG